MSPRYFSKIDRSVRNTITIEADGPWTLLAPGIAPLQGSGGPIVLAFDLVPSKNDPSSSLKALIIDPDPGSGGPG